MGKLDAKKNLLAFLQKNPNQRKSTDIEKETD